jgi:flagellar basal-body rod protein FlgC
MATFGTMDVGRTGMGFAQYWMDNLAHNLANVGTVRGADEEPFRARLVLAQALTDQIVDSGSGVAVRGVMEDGGDAPVVYEPNHPLADDDGYVTQPVIDLAGQMNDLILANRTYQANARTIQTAHEAYQSALRIGQQ